MNRIYSKEDKILLANVLDKYNAYEKNGISTYTNFLNMGQAKLISSFLDNRKISYSIYQPYPFLEKVIFYFGEYENFVTFYKASITDITHSQILGTLFSLGFDESLIGDIFVEEGYFYYTNLTRMNSFLESNLMMIKGELIKLIKVDEIILNRKHFEEINILVSSMRIDSVVSKITSKSRNQVNEMILDKLVLLNYSELNKMNVLLKEGDILSIRRFGKYKIGKVNGYTKKDNIVLEIIRYI